MSRDDKPLLALTLRHPWAWAIAGPLGKDVENRHWRPGLRLLKGDYFAIHGGKMPKRDEIEGVLSEARNLVRRFGDRIDPGASLTLREAIVEGIVAVARFGGCVTESTSPWFEGPVGWVLENVWRLPDPIPCRGAQGLWEVPPDVRAEIRAQWRAAVAAEREFAHEEPAAR